MGSVNARQRGRPSRLGLCSSKFHCPLPLTLELSQQFSCVLNQEQAFLRRQLPPTPAAIVGLPQRLGRTIAFGEAGGPEHQEPAPVLNHVNLGVYGMAASWLTAKNAFFRGNPNNCEKVRLVRRLLVCHR